MRRLKHNAVRTGRMISADARRFARDESGVMTIFALYIFVCMVLIVGVGIDVMRWERDRSNLQATLDRAVLAAADLDQPLDPSAVVHDYFAKAGMSDALGDIDVVQTLGSRQVTASASETIYTNMMHMTGVEQMQTRAISGAIETIPNVEISLVLDISGSMRFENRMNEMRPAAKRFVNSVLRGGGGSSGTGVGTVTTVNLIPYAGQTNPGPVMFNYLNGIRAGETEVAGGHFPEQSSGIQDIVLYSDRTTSDSARWDYKVRLDNFPSSGSSDFISNDLDKFWEHVRDYARRNASAIASQTQVIGVSIKNGNGTITYHNVNGSLSGSNAPNVTASGSSNQHNNGLNVTLDYEDFHDQIIPNISSCLEMTSSDFTHAGIPTGSRLQVGHFMKWDIAASVMDWGWCPADRSAIQYAQTDPAALSTFIDDIRMHDGTGTFYAMKWAVALLNPTSQAAFDHLRANSQIPAGVTNRPAAWTAPDTTKYIVLMTDGQITDQFRPVHKLDPIHGIEEFDDQPSANSYRSDTRSTNLSRFYAQCNLAKQNGVIVYTIAFDAPSGASNEMRNCASSANHFFRVDNGGLDNAFTAIASQINELRLTQ